jgi:hypothetical protein
MAARSTFELTIKGQDPSPDTNSYIEPTTSSRVIKKTLLQGADDDEMTTLFVKDTADAATAQIGTSATVAYDLQTALDAWGDALAQTDIVLLFLEHKAASAASSISFQASAANGLTTLLSATANLTLSPGDFILVGAFTADNLVVSGASKSVDIINDDGSNVADYRFEVWGRIG